MAHVIKSHSIYLEFHKTSNTKKKCNLSICTSTYLKISTHLTISKSVCF